MSTRTEKIKIESQRGFHYDITLEHKPHHGFTSAIYCGNIIGQVELGRITEPLSDDDREWERYEELYSEWTDEIKTCIIPICKKHFDQATF